jgi:phosphoribosylcarboxyaminoimidazole (NCAIR) mutase
MEELAARDRFAMAALNGLMGTVTMPDKLKAVDIQILDRRNAQILATRAYQIADAMLIEKIKST